MRRLGRLRLLLALRLMTRSRRVHDLRWLLARRAAETTAIHVLRLFGIHLEVVFLGAVVHNEVWRETHLVRVHVLLVRAFIALVLHGSDVLSVVRLKCFSGLCSHEPRHLLVLPVRVGDL